MYYNYYIVYTLDLRTTSICHKMQTFNFTNVFYNINVSFKTVYQYTILIVYKFQYLYLFYCY